MNGSAPRARRSRRRRRRTPADISGWRSWGPTAIVIAALAALLLVPVLIRSERSEIRRVVVGIAEPALVLTTQLNVAYAREAVAYRNFLLTGNPAYLENYIAARGVDRRTVRELRPLIRRLGPAIEERLDRVVALAADWQAAPDSLVAGELTRETLIQRTGEQQRRYVATLERTRDLSAAVTARMDRLNRRIDTIDQRAQEATVGLTVLALIAAGIVVRLDRRRRRYAQDLDRRRRAEIALRRAAERITASETIEEAAHAVARSALASLDADGAVLGRATDDPEVMETVAVAGMHLSDPGERLLHDPSLSERIVRSDEPIGAGRLARAHPPLPPAIAERCPDCTGIAVPLRMGGAFMGGLLVVRAPGRAPFDADDLDRARTFAQLASLGYRKVELLAEAERRGDQLAAALESRAVLIRGFSHDVKNPLAAARGYLELLERSVAEPSLERHRRHIGRITRLIDVATRLTENLVTLARAEAGELIVERVPVDVCEIAREAAEDYRGDADVAGLSLELDLPPRCPLIESDEARIAQILSNLLSNAIRYTPSGGRITLRARVRAGAAAPGPGRWIAVDVSDTGPGIPEEEQEAVFQEFIRTAPGKAAVHGAGLGLAIARRLARLLGGDITIRSRVGAGSTFTLWLPERHAGDARDRAA